MEEPRKNWQKVKLVLLLELLRQETDAEHPMTTAEICARMAKMGVKLCRSTLPEDISILNDIGLEVFPAKVGKSFAYYIEDRSFDVSELKILMDAVLAARFITAAKTQEMVAKIAALGGTHCAELLKSNIAYFNTRKHSNKSIFYSVDVIERALQQRRKVIFRYFDLDFDRSPMYRKDGKYYFVEPVALVYNDDNYYLVAYSKYYDKISNYRIDRMDQVQLLDEPVSERALKERESIGESMGQTMRMYYGEAQDVLLEFERSIAGAVFDRFGEDTVMNPVGEDRAKAMVRVQVSPPFYGWLFQFGKKIRIVKPDAVLAAYRAMAGEIANS